MIALSILAGFLLVGLLLALVLYRLGSRWLDQREKEIRGEVENEGQAGTDSDEALAEKVRRGPQAWTEAETRAWVEEERARGRSPQEIADDLNDRELLFQI